MRRVRVTLLQWQYNKYCIIWVLLVALGIQHAMPMRHIVICDMSGSTTFFQIIFYTERFSGNVIEYLFLLTLQICLKYFSFCEEFSEVSELYIGPQAKCPCLFLSNINHASTLSTFSKNIQRSNFTKIRPVGADLFHTDRQTHRGTDRRKDRNRKANSRF